MLKCESSFGFFSGMKKGKIDDSFMKVTSKTIQFLIFVRSFAFSIVAVSQSCVLPFYLPGEVHFIKMLSSARPLKKSQSDEAIFFYVSTATSRKPQSCQERTTSEFVAFL